MAEMDTISLCLIDNAMHDPFDLTLGDEHAVEKPIAQPTLFKQIARPKKLRMSCTACSNSKVKCEKEKPSCSRCLQRGQICCYMEPRRIGRRPKFKPARPSPELFGEQGGRPISDEEWKSAHDSSIFSSTCDTTLSGYSFETICATPNNATAIAIDERISSSAVYSKADPESSFISNGKGFDLMDLRLSSSPDTYTTHSPGSPDLSSPQDSSPGESSEWQLLASPQPCDQNQATALANQLEIEPTPTTRQSCECISQLLATTASTSPRSRQSYAYNAVQRQELKRTEPLISTHDPFDVCTRVLNCPCLSYDERAISLVAFVIMHMLLPFDSAEQPKTQSSESELQQLLALVKRLALRLHACQPGFARVKNNIFVQYWLATTGC